MKMKQALDSAPHVEPVCLLAISQLVFISLKLLLTPANFPRLSQIISKS
jgi:hypothetical protein